MQILAVQSLPLHHITRPNMKCCALIAVNGQFVIMMPLALLTELIIMPVMIQGLADCLFTGDSGIYARELVRAELVMYLAYPSPHQLVPAP